MFLKTGKGQSLLEYTIVLLVAVSALLIMQFYLKRSYQGRLKAEADAVGNQYAPGFTTSDIRTTANSVSTSVTEEGITTVTVDPSHSVYSKDETVDSFAREF